MNRSYHLLGVALALGLMARAGAQSASELPGAKDSTVISRYAGSVLQNAASEAFAAVRVPAGPGRYTSAGALVFDKSTPVEGRISSYFYLAPKERSALEVFRNYRAALSQAGFTTLYSCEMQACDEALIREPFPAEVARPRKWTESRGDPSSSIDRDVRFISAKATRNGADVYVMAFVAEPNSIWQAPATVVIVAEPAAMDTGKVTIGADQLQKGLAAEGRIALCTASTSTPAARSSSPSRSRSSTRWRACSRPTAR